MRTPIDFYLDNPGYINGLIALCEFVQNVPKMDYGPEIARKVEVFINKKSMHGVTNVWPFNEIKYVNTKDKDCDWSVSNMHDNIMENRDVSSFLTNFDLFLKSSSELREAEVKLAEAKLWLLNNDTWWVGRKSPDAPYQQTTLEHLEKLVSQKRQISELARLECDKLLMKVLMKKTMIVFKDGDGDDFVPEKFSLTVRRSV